MGLVSVVEFNIFPSGKDLGIVPGAKWLPHFTSEGEEGIRKDFFMENQALPNTGTALGSSETPGRCSENNWIWHSVTGWCWVKD